MDFSVITVDDEVVIYLLFFSVECEIKSIFLEKKLLVFLLQVAIAGNACTSIIGIQVSKDNIRLSRVDCMTREATY